MIDDARFAALRVFLVDDVTNRVPKSSWARRHRFGNPRCIEVSPSIPWVKGPTSVKQSGAECATPTCLRRSRIATGRPT